MAQAKGKAAAGRLAVRGKRSCKSYALRMQRDRVAESWDILDELSQVGACGVGAGSALAGSFWTVAAAAAR